MRFKWLQFLSKDDKQLKAYESWTVRWTSWHKAYSMADPETQAEVFTNKEDAETFIESLKAARKLLKDSQLRYEIIKN